MLMLFRTQFCTLLENVLQWRLRRNTDWSTNLQALYIIRKRDGICLFYHHFKISHISQIETQLVGMGFAALLNMMKEILDSRSKIQRIDSGDFQILFDERESIVSILFTKDYKPIIRRKFSRMVDSFENLFFLQQQITDQNITVCLEDYALASDIVSYVFFDIPKQTLGFIPIVFKNIHHPPSRSHILRKKSYKASEVKNLEVKPEKSVLNFKEY